MAYIVAWAAGGLLVVSSIVAELFLRRGEHAPLPTPADLAVCNQDVRQLLTDLGMTAASLQEAAVSGEPKNLGGQWEEFGRTWQEQWDMVGRRCQFDERSDTGLGPAYDRMAWVHRNLPTVKLKYREMMKRFTDELAGELAAMRRALDKSRLLLDKTSSGTGKQP